MSPLPRRPPHGITFLLVGATTLAALFAACSDGDPTEDIGGDSDVAAVDDSTGTTDPDAGQDTAGDDPTTTGSETTASESTATESSSNTSTTEGNELSGEPWDGFAADGDTFGVVGVAHDDVLNVRQMPDAGSAIIATLGPTESGVEATGGGWLQPSSIWYEVRTGAGVGWVNARFVAFIGGTDDATAEYIATGSRTGAETLTELADDVADAFIIDDEPRTRVVQSVAPTVGDLGEIAYDLIGLGDDAVGGYRLRILATPNGAEGFDLKSIERTYLCSRGSDGELCA